MEVITSTDNKTVKRICKLKQKKYRDEYGEFLWKALKTCSTVVPRAPILCVLSR